MTVVLLMTIPTGIRIAPGGIPIVPGEIPRGIVAVRGIREDLTGIPTGKKRLLWVEFFCVT